MIRPFLYHWIIFKSSWDQTYNLEDNPLLGIRLQEICTCRIFTTDLFDILLLSCWLVFYYQSLWWSFLDLSFALFHYFQSPPNSVLLDLSAHSVSPYCFHALHDVICCLVLGMGGKHPSCGHFCYSNNKEILVCHVISYQLITSSANKDVQCVLHDNSRNSEDEGLELVTILACYLSFRTTFFSIAVMHQYDYHSQILPLIVPAFSHYLSVVHSNVSL